MPKCAFLSLQDDFTRGIQSPFTHCFSKLQNDFAAMQPGDGVCEHGNLESGLHSYSSGQKQACCTSTLLIKVRFTNISDLKTNNPFSPPRESTHDQVLLKYL